MNMEMLDLLKELIGENNICIDPFILATHSRDFNNFGTAPDCVVTCHTKDEIKKVLQFADEYLIPVTAKSSATNYYGAAIPSYGGILLNLQEMKKINRIDTSSNKFATIEPGVTFEELQKELDKVGFQVMMPLNVTCKNSVVSTYLERTPLLSGPIPILSNGWQVILDMDVSLPNGETFHTGSAEATPKFPNLTPHGVTGPDFSRVFTAAQGTMGIISEMTVKIKPKFPFESLFVQTADNVYDLLELVARLKKLDIGREILIASNLNISSILAEDFDHIDELRDILPEWVMLLRITGYDEPELKINEADLDDFKLVNQLKTLELLTDMQLAELLLKEFKLPNKLMNYRYYKGHCQTLSFYTEIDKIEDFNDQIEQLAKAYDYSIPDLYGFVMPIEQARTFYFEYNFHSDPSDIDNYHKVQKFYADAAKIIINNGGIIDRPYGLLADLIYEKIPKYYNTLMIVKDWFDPNNILNPGKLFES